MKKMTDRNLKHAIKKAEAEQGNPVTAVVEKDAMLRTDNLMTRSSFQGRFRRSCVGDRKGRSGHGPEQVEAILEDTNRDLAKVTMEEAAVAADVVIETDKAGPEDFVGTADPTPSGIVL